MNDMLRTWEWDLVRIVKDEDVKDAAYLRDDDLGEWSYYVLCGEVVAVNNWEAEREAWT